MVVQRYKADIPERLIFCILTIAAGQMLQYYFLMDKRRALGILHILTSFAISLGKCQMLLEVA